MDVMLLSERTIRVKGRNSTIIINPAVGVGKTEAQAILKLDKSQNYSEGKIEGSRITIKGAGEYEVNGAKVSAIAVDGKLVARLEVDGVTAVVGSGVLLEKIHEKVEGCNLAIIEADQKFNYSMLSTLEPNALIVYGKEKEDVRKSLGKEATVVSRFSTTAEKLPSEMQFVLLG